MAHDSTPPQFEKSIELEQRLARLEVCYAEFREMLDELRHHVVALKAHVDHLAAKIRY